MEPEILDTPFNWPYTAQDLTVAVNRQTNRYGLITDLGLFGTGQGLATRFARIKYAEGRFHILAAEEVDGTPQTQADDDESEVIVKIPHFPVLDRVTVSDVQDRVARLGRPNELETFEAVVDRKLQKMFRSHEITWEYIRVGALLGQIRDGKGRLILDLYQAFEVQQKVVYFDFANADSPIQDLCWDVSRHMEDNAQGEAFDGVHVPVSREFMSGLAQHPQTREAFKNYSVAATILGGDSRKRFEFGGLVFEEYNGTAPLQDGTSQRFLPAGQGVAVPLNTMETFAEFDAPPAHIAAANMPPDAKIFITQEIMRHGMGVEMKSQSNPLAVVTRPELVVRVSAAADPG